MVKRLKEFLDFVFNWIFTPVEVRWAVRELDVTAVSIGRDVWIFSPEQAKQVCFMLHHVLVNKMREIKIMLVNDFVKGLPESQVMHLDFGTVVVKFWDVPLQDGRVQLTIAIPDWAAQKLSRKLKRWCFTELKWDGALPRSREESDT